MTYNGHSIRTELRFSDHFNLRKIAVDVWSFENEVQLALIRTGKPVENADV